MGKPHCISLVLYLEGSLLRSILLENGAISDKPDAQGRTPFSESCIAGDLSIIFVLLRDRNAVLELHP